MILITGGARSGKSRHAESLLQSFASVLYIATSAAIDDEMAARIQHHRNSRPPHWRTAERSRDLTPLITPIMHPMKPFCLSASLPGHQYSVR